VILRVSQQPGRGGFTLIELIISAALMAIVIGTAYACLSAGVAGKRLVEARGEGTQSARVALSMMAADLRAAIPLPGKVEFLGMRRTIGEVEAGNLDFSTRNYNQRKLREPDYCEISYFLAPDKESDSFVLMRRRDATPDPEPLEGGVQEEIARGVRGLRFEFYDGYDWFDDWGDPDGKTKGMMYPPSNSYGLPEAVRITIVFDPETRGPRKTSAPHPGPLPEGEGEKAPMTFQTTARLDLAAYFNRQAVSQSNNNGNNGGEGGQPGAPGAEGVGQ
jgi:prepilin-type N-terminal cleavage/methylation domain-containing protein